MSGAVRICVPLCERNGTRNAAKTDVSGPGHATRPFYPLAIDGESVLDTNFNLLFFSFTNTVSSVEA